MTVYLSDDSIACEQTPKPCGCAGAPTPCGNGGGGYGLPVININVDSNNKEGYNTLNPGSIDRERTVMPVYPGSPTVVQPSVVAQNSSVIGGSSISPGTTSAAQASAGIPKSTVNAQPIVKKKRVFSPEFL